MEKLTYFAIFEPCGEGYSVYFPDLPGCISVGDNLESAYTGAREALGLHIYGMKCDGDALPSPSAHPAIDPETQTDYLVMPISIFPALLVTEHDNRRVKTNVTIPAFLKRAAEREGINLSKLLEAAIIDRLGLSSSEI